MPSLDPRLRRAHDNLAQALALATQRTQEALYALHTSYLAPGAARLHDACLDSCAASAAAQRCCACCLAEDEWRRRQRLRERARLRGRAEFSFDFYDDLEDAEADALLGLAGDEGSSGGGGSGSLLESSQHQQHQHQQQLPRRRERQMNYGTRQTLLADDEGTKNIPSSSYFGFLDRLPFKIGTKGFKYRPSIADLQEQPAIRRQLAQRHEAEEEPLLADVESDEEQGYQQRTRARSGTHTSRHTTDSLSSRGDIFPSEDEMDDAVPLDVEYALALERRSTGHTSDGSIRDGKRLSANRSSSQRSIASMSSIGSAMQSERPTLSTQTYHPPFAPNEGANPGLSAETLPSSNRSRQPLESSRPIATAGHEKTPRSADSIPSSPPAASTSAAVLPDGQQRSDTASAPPAASPEPAVFNAAALPRLR